LPIKHPVSIIDFCIFGSTRRDIKLDFWYVVLAALFLVCCEFLIFFRETKFPLPFGERDRVRGKQDTLVMK
jgi:hypothetical protein